MNKVERDDDLLNVDVRMVPENEEAVERYARYLWWATEADRDVSIYEWRYHVQDTEARDKAWEKLNNSGARNHVVAHNFRCEARRDLEWLQDVPQLREREAREIFGDEIAAIEASRRPAWVNRILAGWDAFVDVLSAFR